MSLPTSSIARIVYAAFRQYAATFDQETASWEDLSDDMRKQTLNGILVIQANPGASYQELHALWVEQKIKDGWIQGDIRSFELKTHPLICPWDQLSHKQQTKDKMFVNIVRALS